MKAKISIVRVCRTKEKETARREKGNAGAEYNENSGLWVEEGTLGTCAP